MTEDTQRLSPGPAVARAPVDEVELRVVGAGDPCGPAPAQVGIARGPGLAALFSGTRGGMAAPQVLARVGIVAVDETANAVLAARHPRHQHAVRDRGRR